MELSHVRELAPFVDGWSVMTYDYADGVHAAPNAPLPWLQKNIKLLFAEGQGARRLPLLAEVLTCLPALYNTACMPACTSRQ